MYSYFISVTVHLFMHFYTSLIQLSVVNIINILNELIINILNELC